MNAPDPREEAIVKAALKLSPKERVAYLDQACGEDAQLRERIVQALFSAGEKTGGTVFIPPVSEPAGEKPGDRIGRYKLLQRLGEGGCGIVYMAEQEEPVLRRVALKVIKLGMDTKAVIARFEAERQALALMDHPNIAKVLDAGATETGRPFFVMELVRGIRITDYCDQNKLSTDDRLKLFIQVCQAIQHAHQKGIIHRDIKPSNILVTLHDGLPVPKVIDFGIAKATQGRLTDQTLFTAFEQFIGTPAYMSPEQAEMSGLDIDTRCDIYALGVLLYELLTGCTPFDAKELLAAGLDKLREMIREKEPARPSTRVATMLETDATEVAKRRQSDAPRLVHLLRGDLDWIVMKCLEKDRTRRYETANGLGMDVHRYLTNEPVLARPPSSLYRFQKLVRRNKLVFAAAGAVAAALVAGAVISTTLFIKERKARQRADAAERAQAALLQEALAGRAAEARLRNEAEIGRQYAEAGKILSEQQYDKGQYDKAEQILNEMPPRPEGATLFHTIGIIHAGRKEWQPAITNFTREILSAPSNHMAHHFLAPLLIQVGDVEGYQRLRAEILRQFAQSPDPVVAERMAKDCLLLPPSTADLRVIQKMADTAVAAGPDHPLWLYFQLAKGLAEYRQGHFDAAAERLVKVRSESDGSPAGFYRSAEACLVLAMARHQMGQFWPARGALSEGCWIATTFLPGPDSAFIGEAANDWLYVRALMREAQGLIQTGPNDEVVAKALQPLAGRYDYHIMTNIVTSQGTHLFAQVPGQPEFELCPISDTEFIWSATDWRETFVKDTSGKIIKAIHYQGGTNYDAPRLEDIAQASFDALVGRYDFGRSGIMTVTREEGHLFAQFTHPDRPKYEILPKSALDFVWRASPRGFPDIRVTFLKDGSGKVTKASFYQSGMSAEGQKLN